MESDASDEEPRKKPGRPRKKTSRKQVPKLGIVREPSNSQTEDARLINVFELVYDNPIMFKKIFNLFRALSVANIRVRLERDIIKMHSGDAASDPSQIYVRIYGERLNRYYVAHPLEFGIGSASIQRILQTLTKDCSKIYWFTNVQFERSRIKISLSNEELEEDSIYSLDLDQLDEYDWSVERELMAETSYPLRFELPFRYFKRKISDFSSLGDVMKIEKSGEEPLRLSYVFRNNKGDQHTYYWNPARINLNSAIDPGEIFSASICLDHIAPLAGSLIADAVSIAASIDKKIILSVLLDQDEKTNREKIPNTERCEIKFIVKSLSAASVDSAV